MSERNNSKFAGLWKIFFRSSVNLGFLEFCKAGAARSFIITVTYQLKKN